LSRGIVYKFLIHIHIHIQISGLGEEAGSNIFLAISNTAATISRTAATAFRAQGEGKDVRAPAQGTSGHACTDVPSRALRDQGGGARAAAVTEEELAPLCMHASSQSERRGERSAAVQGPRTPRDTSLPVEARAAAVTEEELVELCMYASSQGGGGTEQAYGVTDRDGEVAITSDAKIEMLTRRSCTRSIDPPRTPERKSGTPGWGGAGRSKGKRAALRTLQLEQFVGPPCLLQKDPSAPRPLVAL
jgi:hypothetical protein